MTTKASPLVAESMLAHEAQIADALLQSQLEQVDLSVTRRAADRETFLVMRTDLCELSQWWQLQKLGEQRPSQGSLKRLLSMTRHFVAGRRRSEQSFSCHCHLDGLLAL